MPNLVKANRIITKIHFFLLGIALFNFILKNTIEISLNYQFAYYITLLVYTSGIVLFIANLKPLRKKLAIYFSLYILTPIFILLAWSIGGIFFGILMALVIYPVYPNEIKAETEQHVIYHKYQGFMSVCCPYEVTEKKFLLLEKKVAEVNSWWTHDFEVISAESKNGNIELRIQYDKYDQNSGRSVTADTTIQIRTD